MKAKLIIAALMLAGMLNLEETDAKELKVTEVSYEDAQMLMKIAQAEAGNQGIEGMSAVMRVVLNRVKNGDYPDTIEEVIKQPYQFESFNNGSYEKAEPSIDCHLALANVEKGMSADKEIIGFETVENGESLTRYFDYAYTIRDHNFYVRKGE
jgi:N-acetylmuramoyl-L-alanine amidase